MQINLLKIHQAEVLEGDLDFHCLLVLLLEWEEVWKVMEHCHKVVVAFDDGEMQWSSSCLVEYCPHQAVPVPQINLVQAPIWVPGEFSHHDLQLPATQIGKGVKVVRTGMAQKRMLYLCLRSH